MDGILDFLLLVYGGTFLFLALLIVVALWKPLLATIPADPEAVSRDLAYRLRANGYPVEVAKGGVLKIRIGSLAALKLHVRSGVAGSEIRYEVDATPSGWALVLILAGFGYAGFAAFVIALVIDLQSRSFARSRVAGLLDHLPLGASLPPQDVRSLLVEGMSEAQRLSQEALESEKEARQNAIGLVLLGGLVLWTLTFLGLGTSWLLPSPLPFVQAVVVSSVVSAGAVVIGSWLVNVNRARRIHELEQETSFYRAAWTSQVLPTPSPVQPRGPLELLLHAAIRSAYWREIRRSRRFWQDPIAGLTIFILGYGAVFVPFLAIVGEFLPLEWRIFLGTLGGIFAMGLLWFIRSWRREIQQQDERDRTSWEERRRAIEEELWRILSG
jgi:hypothetical protein